MALLFRVEPCGLVGGRCRCKPAPGDQGHGSKMESMALLSWRHKKHEVTEVLPAHKTWTSVSTGNPLHGLCAFESKGVVLATLGQAILDLIGWDAARLFASKEVASLWLPRFWLSLLSYDLRAKVSPCLKLILLKKKRHLVRNSNIANDSIWMVGVFPSLGGRVTMAVWQIHQLYTRHLVLTWG